MSAEDTPAGRLPGFDDSPDEGYNRIGSLTPDDRQLVELCAVFGSAPRSEIVRGLGKLGRRMGTRAPTIATTDPLLASLEERGFLSVQGHVRVAPKLIHAAFMSASSSGRLKAMAGIVDAIRPYREHPTWDDVLRELRIALYLGEFQKVLDPVKGVARGGLGDVCRPFDDAWVRRFPRAVLGRVLMDVLDTGLSGLLPSQRAFQMLEALPSKELTDGEHHLLVEQLVLRGRLDDAERVLAERSSVQAKIGSAWILLLRGKVEQSIAAYGVALSAYLKLVGKRAAFFPDRAGFFFLVALVADGKSASLERAKQLALVAAKVTPGLSSAYTVISELSDALCGVVNIDDPLLEGCGVTSSPESTELLTTGLALAWTERQASPAQKKNLVAAAQCANAGGYLWLSWQLEAVLHRLEAGKAQPAGQGPMANCALVDLKRHPERWSQALEDLMLLVASQKATVQVPGVEDRDRRLVWVATCVTYLSLRPIEQTRSKGQWSRGKPVALKRLYDDASTMEWLTRTDRAVASIIREEVSLDYGRFRRVSYTLDPGMALFLLADQPNVFIELNSVLEPMQIRKTSPRLRVVSEGGKIQVTLQPSPGSADENLRVTQVGGPVFELTTFEPTHHAIAKILGTKGLTAPQTAGSRLAEVVSALSKLVTVEADSAPQARPEGDQTAAAAQPGLVDEPETTQADPRPYFNLRAVGTGLGVEVVVKALGKEGPATPPGQGGAALFAQVSGRALVAKRDLAQEKERAERALSTCKTLTSAQTGPFSYLLPDREVALEALSEIQALASCDAEVRVEWQGSPAFTLSAACGSGSLHVDIRKKKEVFEVAGTLDVPDRGPLALGTLLEYLAASPGRFLQMKGDAEFLLLTSELRHRLELLWALGGRGKTPSFHPLAAGFLDDTLSGSQVTADAAYRTAVRRLTEGEEAAPIPSTFRAELRPYQMDGYRWLARLSAYGFGGCLADEMGLGKTVQALALLVLRGATGPSLVVAPTSLVSQWGDEMARFAPTLRPRFYTGEERSGALQDLKPFDVVLTSYTILQLDAERLAKKTFEVALLDEAQAIKNADTQRAKAAFGLSARARFATTGTPIENRLAELHSLFRFLNPGFLGSEKAFEERFVRPIERDKSVVAAEGLRRMVSPFLLRRTKSQVLAELPARTEVTLRVALNREEMALYEAIRAQAVKTLLGAPSGPKQRIQLLAIITKLRRAASNAKMVMPDSQAESAKLETLAELFDELLQGGHRVLVFSQFVDHLTQIRALVEERKMAYQYLDGSTKAPKRKAAVEAFQAGQGDVFLISLKAGGFGLNLTAADSVIHMDPWWNPATEDQASDRAHRIGQTRPVTIYRVIAKDTIEEKILGLHHRKRDLAQNLLEDAEHAAALSEDELLGLIREGALLA